MHEPTSAFRRGSFSGELTSSKKTSRTSSGLRAGLGVGFLLPWEGTSPDDKGSCTPHLPWCCFPLPTAAAHCARPASCPLGASIAGRPRATGGTAEHPMREALADGAAWSKLCGPCRRVLVGIGAESRAFPRKAPSPRPPQPRCACRTASSSAAPCWEGRQEGEAGDKRQLSSPSLGCLPLISPGAEQGASLGTSPPRGQRKGCEHELSSPWPWTLRKGDQGSCLKITWAVQTPRLGEQARILALPLTTSVILSRWVLRIIKP